MDLDLKGTKALVTGGTRASGTRLPIRWPRKARMWRFAPAMPTR